MKRRKILYLICLVVVFAVNIFYVEYQIFILLVLMIAVPLVSWLLYIISNVNMGLSLQVSQNVVVEGGKIKVRVAKKRRMNLAFVNADINIRYMYHNTRDEFSKTVPVVSGYDKYAGRVDIPASFCGIVYIGVDMIDMQDYLGFFNKRKKFTGMTRVCIMPKNIPSDYIPNEGALSKMDENDLRIKGAGDEITELREYRDGDSPRNIHWKRSSVLPEDGFVIKEYDLDVYRTIIYVIDTNAVGNVDNLERMSRIYEKAFSQGLACVQNGMIGEYVIWDSSKDNIRRKRFYDEISCAKALIAVMEVRCSKDALGKACQALYEDSTLELSSEPVIITEDKR